MKYIFVSKIILASIIAIIFSLSLVFAVMLLFPLSADDIMPTMPGDLPYWVIIKSQTEIVQDGQFVLVPAYWLYYTSDKAYYNNGYLQSASQVKIYTYVPASYSTWLYSQAISGTNFCYISSPTVIYNANYDIKTSTGAIYYDAVIPLNYQMKSMDENGLIHEYLFQNQPVYYGSGANWLILSINGEYTIDGVAGQSTIVKVQGLISKNFIINDAQGHEVMGLKTGTAVRRISGITPDATYLDSTYSKVQYYLTTSNTPILTYNDQTSITNNALASFNVLAGFAAIRTDTLSKWQITNNTWFITDTTGAPVPPQEFEDIANKPVKENYEDTIYGSISYSVDMLAYYLKMPFVFIGNILQKIVDSLGSAIEETAGVSLMLSKLFGFLPPEVTTLIVGLFSIAGLMVVYRLARR